MKAAARKLAWLAVAGMAAVPILPGCGCRPDTVLTETDFRSDEERLDFLTDFVPFTIPASAQDIRFTYVSWLDWRLELFFTLPVGELRPLYDRLMSESTSQGGGILIRDTERRIETVVDFSFDRCLVMVKSNNMTGPGIPGESDLENGAAETADSGAAESRPLVPP